MFVLAKPSLLSTAPPSNPSRGDTVLPQIFNRGIKGFSWQEAGAAPRMQLCSGWQGTACPGLLRAPHNPCWFSSPVLLTGSRPSMASIHSLRSSSDSACMVITPGLQGEAQVAKMNFSSEEEGRRTSSLPAPGGQTPRASLQGAGSAGEQSTATIHSSGVLCMSWGPNSSSGPQAGSSPALGQADHGTAGEGREVTGKGDQGRGQGKGDRGKVTGNGDMGR